ncbi:nuclear transport factor 2 family protein [Psychrobacillus sp. MER TA 171]|nr:nuclear transport factor 2 family protein [Psychrobacillus sp. MER TA 171]
MKESNRMIKESFHTVLIKHLDLMQNKDIIPFLQTISEQEDISVIMPNGRLISGYKDVAEFNKDWFADIDWSLSYQIIKEECTDEMGYAVVEIEYKDVDQNGNPYNKIYYLTLIFKKNNEKWLLVHDQNTFT